MFYRTSKLLLGASVSLALSAFAANAALTTTYVGNPGDPANGSSSSVGGVHTIGDTTQGGDIWAEGDTFTYLHESSRVTGSFTATARVVAQSEAANGTWGKGGIMVRDSLSFDSPHAMVQLAAGNNSQPGGMFPVDVRLAGRNGPAINNVFEDNVGVPNDTFRTDGGVNFTWISINYDAGTNGFTAGVAPDVAGAPGAWTFSATRTNVVDTNPGDGWFVGLAYSAHDSMSLGGAANREGIHTISFDNFTIPEPSAPLLGLFSLFGLLVLRRRRA